MAMNLSNLDNVLKVNYRPKLRDQLHNETILANKIKVDAAQKVQGKTITVALRTGRNLSAGSGRADGGTLPTASQQGYNVAVIPQRYIYGRIQVTGPAIAASASDVGAFVRALDSEVQGLTDDTSVAMNRMYNSDGTDAIAFWTSADNTSGTDVDDGQGNPFVHLQDGAQTLDLIDGTDHTTKNGNSIVVTLGAEAATAYAITWTGTVTNSADGDYLTTEDSIGKQCMGIRGIISASDPPDANGGLSSGLHGLPVASKPFWKAASYTNSGTNRALTLPLLQKPLSKISVTSNGSGEKVKFLLSNVFARDEYLKILQADKRFVNTMTLDGGFDAVDYNGKPWVTDAQCRRNTVYYINPDSMRRYQSSDFDFMERDGSMFNRVANTDAYEATLFYYGDLGCTMRNANGILGDITEG